MAAINKKVYYTESIIFYVVTDKFQNDVVQNLIK